MEELNKFREVFWDAFHRPKLKSEKYHNIWHNLEGVNGMLAGPLFSIYESGDCNYIFIDKDRFPEMNDADDLLNWLMGFVEEYRNTILLTRPESDDESDDLQVLLYQTDMKMELADLAYQIEKKRLHE